MQTRRSFIGGCLTLGGLGGISGRACKSNDSKEELITPPGWNIIQGKRSGWYVVDTDWWQRLCLHKDLSLHIDTGWCFHKYGEAPGFWPTKEAARNAILQYQRKLKKQDREFPPYPDWTCYTRLNQHQNMLQGKIDTLDFENKIITVHVNSLIAAEKSGRVKRPFGNLAT